MAEYSVRHGQTLIDVILMCYGNLQGMGDFMISNPDLSFGSLLQDGQIVQYNPPNAADQITVNYYYRHRIFPTNGSRDIYYKEATYKRMLSFDIAGTSSRCDLRIGGTGVIEIDWGDNSPLQTVVLAESNFVSHEFNVLTSATRKIKIYGEGVKFTNFSLRGTNFQKILLFDAISMETVDLSYNIPLRNINPIGLLKDVNSISFERTKLLGATPLIALEKLRTINLNSCGLTTTMIDAYLIGLVKNYQSRLIAELDLRGNQPPSGNYEPPMSYQNPTTGQEARWILENDPDRGWTILIDE